MFSKNKSIFVLVMSMVFLMSQYSWGDEKTEAKRHFVNGTEMMELEDFAGAAVEFEASMKLYKNKNAVFNLAMCYKALHKYPQALEMFRILLGEFSGDLSAEVKAEVRSNIKSMSKMISQIEITTNLPGATILLDGEKIGTSPLAKPIKVGAGEHRVRASLKGHHDQETTVSVVSGKNQIVEFTLKPVEKAAPAVVATGQAAGMKDGLPEEQVEVETALGKSLSRDYRYYTRSHTDEKMSFAAYEYKKARKKWIGGIIHLAVIAPIVQGIGIGLYLGIMSTVEEPRNDIGGTFDETDNNAKKGAAAVLLGLCTVGTLITVIVGAVKVGRGGKAKRRLKPLLQKEKKTALGGVRFAGVSPLGGYDSMPSGLSLNFSF